MNGRQPAIGASLQVGLADPEDAVERTDPEISAPVVLDVADDIVKQSLPGAEVGQAIVLEPAQAVRRANPDRAIFILAQAAHKITRQSVLLAELFQPARGQAEQAFADGAKPDVARPAFDDATHVPLCGNSVVGKPGFFPGGVKTQQPYRRSNPHPALARRIQRRHGNGDFLHSRRAFKMIAASQKQAGTPGAGPSIA